MDVKTVSFDGKAWSEALPALDSERTLVLVFGASELGDSRAALATLAKTYPTSHVVGCSSAGEIFGTKVVDDSLAVAVARFDHTSLATAYASVDVAADSHAAGQAIARALAKPGLRAILILSDGLNVNGSELVRGVSECGKDVVVTGGLAGDGSRFKQTWVLENGEATSRSRQSSVTAVGRIVPFVSRWTGRVTVLSSSIQADWFCCSNGSRPVITSIGSGASSLSRSTISSAVRCWVSELSRKRLASQVHPVSQKLQLKLQPISRRNTARFSSSVASSASWRARRCGR
jgi:hypothetical protein